MGKKRYSSSKVLNELAQLINANSNSKRSDLISGLKIAIGGVILGLALFAFMDFRSANQPGAKSRKIRSESSRRPSVQKKRRLRKAAERPRKQSTRRPASKARKAHPKVKLIRLKPRVDLKVGLKVTLRARP